MPLVALPLAGLKRVNNENFYTPVEKTAGRKVTSHTSVCYLLGEVVVLVVGHAGGDMVDDLGGGGGVVRRSLACTAIPLETSHEATVSSKVHLKDTQDTLKIL